MQTKNVTDTEVRLKIKKLYSGGLRLQDIVDTLVADGVVFKTPTSAISIVSSIAREMGCKGRYNIGGTPPTPKVTKKPAKATGWEAVVNRVLDVLRSDMTATNRAELAKSLLENAKKSA